MSHNFYLTTTLPYVNAQPHLGFAWEILTADFIVRFHRLLGDQVIFNTGVDEHGQKIFEKACLNQLKPQAYVDQLATAFQALKPLLNLSLTHFIRTTDPHHVAAAQEFWRRCAEAGDIYQQKYHSKYCVGCELEKTDSELVAGRCPLHPHQELEIREETNYFFRFSKYRQPLLDFYQAHPDFVLGSGKMTELLSFVNRGLKDFSISRLAAKMPWGIPVPGDDTQVMYVWFDALVNYISTLGWPASSANFTAFWPGTQLCGKDNLRQQAAMWQAMLLSAGLPPSRQILVNGFITVAGQKMSKSLGNVISPDDLIGHYGLDATRFILASLPVLAGDADLTPTRLHDFYTANLVNGLGNLASRLAKLASSLADPFSLPPITTFSAPFHEQMTKFLTHQALAAIITRVGELDQQLSASRPWLITDQVEKLRLLQPLIQAFRQIIYDLQPFMPDTAAQLDHHFSAAKITPLTPLFPRLKL